MSSPLENTAKKISETTGEWVHDGGQAIKKKTDKVIKKAKAVKQQSCDYSKKVVDVAVNHNVPTDVVSKIGFWSGLSSIIVGFPANLIGIVSGHIVEDRRKMGHNDVFKKTGTELVPTGDQLKKSRIGAVAGYVSLIGGLVAVVCGIAELKKRAK